MVILSILTHKLKTVNVEANFTRKVCMDCGDVFMSLEAGWIEASGRRKCPGPQKEDIDGSNG